MLSPEVEMGALKRAFTLIELLVVIAIIAILAAILFPVFAEAKNSARLTVCISNMKQMGAACQLYLIDYDDVWVPAANNTSAGPQFRPQNPWIGFDTANDPGNGLFQGNMQKPAVNPIRPGGVDIYLKNHQVKQCPSRPSQWQLASAFNYFHSVQRIGGTLVNLPSAYHTVNPTAIGQEFGPGSKIIDRDLGYVVTEAASDSEVEQSSNTLLMWEHGNPSPVCNFLFPPSWYDVPPPDPMYRDHFNFLHRNGTTALWCDGHANRMTYGKLRRPMFSCRKDIYE